MVRSGKQWCGSAVGGGCGGSTGFTEQERCPAPAFCSGDVTLAGVPGNSFLLPGVHHVSTGLLQPALRSRAGSSCVRPGRLGKRPEKLAFLSQEEKTGLCDGWHARRACVFSVVLGEGLLSFRLGQHICRRRRTRVYGHCSFIRLLRRESGVSLPSRSELRSFLALSVLWVSAGPPEVARPVVVRGLWLVSAVCSGGGRRSSLSHSCCQGAEQIGTATAPACTPGTSLFLTSSST